MRDLDEFISVLFTCDEGTTSYKLGWQYKESKDGREGWITQWARPSDDVKKLFDEAKKAKEWMMKG